MPVRIERKGSGFVVCDPERCFSKKPMLKRQARKQQIAIALSESRKTKKPVGFFMDSPKGYLP